ncbi:flagellar basal body protein [Caldimonas caldifontis]|uniref:Flagellar basal body rod protein n=1 Tax=Caldimonas caldifontis TaxID=1452508 RepID=A0A2S5SYF1_9BURK|nr:flagellar basal body protein [Caldimonas caldifontis]PPE67795.1 flagellar basal body rod protein [Caldimonas caldifontis]
MNSLPAIAYSGLQAASAQLGVAAHNIANDQTPGFRRQQVVQEAQASGGVQATVVPATVPGMSLPQEVVQQMVASYAYKANALTLQTHQRMVGSLLDTQA